MNKGNYSIRQCVHTDIVTKLINLIVLKGLATRQHFICFSHFIAEQLDNIKGGVKCHFEAHFARISTPV